MDIIIGVLFVIFMFLVDWRLSKILDELKLMNKTKEPTAVPPSAAQP